MTKSMNLTQSVVAIVKQKGAATVDEIQMEGITRDQVMQALKNAKKRGFLDCDGIEGQGRGMGRMPGVYRPMGEHGNSMRTTVQKVATVIQERGAATLDDLGALFPDLTREQLAKALSNAKARGLIRLDVRGVGGPNSTPGVWAAGHARVGNYNPKENRMTRPANSPWELGEELRVSGRWPPTFADGRRFQPLGAWTEEAEAS